MTDDRWPFDVRIADSGFPFGAATLESRDDGFVWQQLYPLFKRLDDGFTKSWVALRILREGPYHVPQNLSDSTGKIRVQSNELRSVIDHTGENLRDMDLNILNVIVYPNPIGEDWVELLDLLGRNYPEFLSRSMMHQEEEHATLVKQLENWYNLHSDKFPGLLNVIAPITSVGAGSSISLHLLDPDNYDDDALKRSAAIVRLCMTDWDHDELLRLTKILANNVYAIYAGIRLSGSSDHQERFGNYLTALIDEYTLASEDEKKQQIWNYTFINDWLV